jgi:hypothetical protein
MERNEVPQEFVDLSLTRLPHVSCGPFDVLYGTNPPEAMEKSSHQQVTDHNRSQKADSQVQLRASTPEAMAKILTQATSHQYYSEIFHNLHDSDEFAMDVVKMGGPVAQPVEIHTSDLVLVFFLTHAHFGVSLKDAMAIILKRSQNEMFSAPVEWANFIQQCKAEVPIYEAVVEFAADTTLEVRRKKRLDDEVSLVALRVEVQADETRMLPERGQMTSTDGSHGHVKRCMGVYDVEYVLLARK